MIPTLVALFLGILLGLHALFSDGGSLATTGLIVLVWLAAGVAVGFLMARSR